MKDLQQYVRIGSWSLYDFANQFFALNIVSLYFVRWLVIEKSTPELYYSIAFGISVFLVSLCAPLLGSLADILRCPRIFLVAFTTLCVVFLAGLSYTSNVFWALAFFAIANFGCQMAVVFYNSLLVSVAPMSKIGLISGFGRMFGYCGALFALYVINPQLFPLGYQTIFLGTAVIFFVFSLPCMLFVKDRNPNPNILSFFSENHFLHIVRKIRNGLKGTYQLPGMKPFLKTAFWGLGPVNVVLLFIVVYAKMVFNINETQITHMIALGTIFAIIGSIASGFVSDYIGYRRCLGGIFILWIISFLVGSLSQGTIFFIPLGILSGLALGATFAVSRAVALKIVPRNKTSEAFGLFNLVGYLASVTGALYWGMFLFVLQPLGVVRYRLALFSLIIFMCIGLYHLSKVSVLSDTRRKELEAVLR